MERDDIETLERVTSKYKIRYDIMEVSYKDELIGTKLYMAVNVTQLVSDMELFRQTLSNTEDFELHCAISIMNLFAHYKHFYLSRADVTRCTIIGFVKDGYAYDRYHKILDIIVQICEFFKDVYFIPNVYQFNMTHIVCACIQYMDSFSIQKITLPRTIHILSAYNMDKQIMNCIPVKTAHKFSKKMSGQLDDTSKEMMMRELFKTEGYYANSLYKSELDALVMQLGKFFNSLVCTSSKDNKGNNSVKYTVKRAKDKIELLDDFLKNGYDISCPLGISPQFFAYLKNHNVFVSNVDENNYCDYLKKCDFRFKNIGILNTALAPLIDTWKKKIKDYAIARESEQYKMLVKHELYIDWL